MTRCEHGVDWDEVCDECIKESDELRRQCPVGYGGAF